MAWVDRLIYDSSEWPDPVEQFKVVRKIEAHADLDTVLADLNWTRLRGWRLALAQFLDLEGATAAFAKLTTLEVTFGPDAGLAAMLLTGWLAAQLGWKAPVEPAGDPSFHGPAGQTIAVTFLEGQDAGILQVKLTAGDGSEFSVTHEPASGFLNTKAVVGAYGRCEQQVLPIGAVELADLVSSELVHGGEHRVYLKVLGLIVPMLG